MTELALVPSVTCSVREKGMLCYSTNYHTLSWPVRVSDCGYYIYLKNNVDFRIFAGKTLYNDYRNRFQSSDFAGLLARAGPAGGKGSGAGAVRKS